MFYSLVVEGGTEKEVECVADLKITHVTLAPGQYDKNARFYLTATVDDVESILCSVAHGSQENASLDVIFEAEAVVKFTVNGNGKLHVVGYYIIDDSMFEGGSEDDEDISGEEGEDSSLSGEDELDVEKPHQGRTMTQAAAEGAKFLAKTGFQEGARKTDDKKKADDGKKKGGDHKPHQAPAPAKKEAVEHKPQHTPAKKEAGEHKPQHTPAKKEAGEHKQTPAKKEGHAPQTPGKKDAGTPSKAEQHAAKPKGAKPQESPSGPKGTPGAKKQIKK